MANEIRVRQNITKGKISDSPLTAAASQINSLQFASLPVIDSTMHMPLTLAPVGIDGNGAAIATEIVWVIGHAANATYVDVLRGRENTTPTQYPNGTAWAHAQTAWDFPGATGTAFLGTDVNFYRVGSDTQNGPAGLGTDDSINVRGGYGTTDWSPNRVVLGSGGTSPNAGSVAFGNNTGWLLNFGTLNGSVFDTRFQFDDRGRFVVAAPPGSVVNLQEWTVGGVAVAYWTASGQLFFGSDTNLSRSGVSTLKANGSFQFGGAITMLNGANLTITAGAGSPEGVVTANPGSTYHNTSGGTGTTYYVKETGIGNTGWMPAGSSGSTGVAAHQATHQSGGSDALTGTIDATARLSIALNGAALGTRRQLNLVAGTGVTFTNTSDDAANERVNVTINSSGGSGALSQVSYQFWEGIPGGGAQTSLETNPFLPTHLIGGSDTGGIHFSFDAGKTWRVKQNGITFFQARKVADVKWSTVSPPRAFCAVGNGKTNNGGFYYTNDNGNNWRRMDGGAFTELIFNGGNNLGPDSPPLPTGAWPRSCANLIDLDEANGHIYVGTYANGVWRIDFSVAADGSLTTTGIVQIGTTANKLIRAVKLMTSYQRTGGTLSTLFFSVAGSGLWRSTNCNAGSPTGALLSSSPATLIEGIDYIQGNTAGAATALYVVATGGVWCSVNPTVASPTFTNLAGGAGPETASTWMSVRVYENSAGQYVVFVGCFNPAAASTTAQINPATGQGRYNSFYKGVAAGSSPTTGVTWTVCGTDWTKVHKFLWHQEKPWWLPNEQNQLGGSTFACPDIAINQYFPDDIIIATRATNWKTEDGGLTWYATAEGVGAVGIGMFSADPRPPSVAPNSPGRVALIDTDHVAYFTYDYFQDIYFNQFVPASGTTNTGRAIHIRGVDGKVTGSGGNSNNQLDPASSVFSALDPFRDAWTNENWDTTDDTTTSYMQPIAVLSGIDSGGVEFFMGIGDMGYGVWRKQKTGTWTGANNAGTQSSITANNWGRVLPVSPTLASRANEPFSTTTNLNTTPAGETAPKRNPQPYAVLISTGTTTGNDWGQHVFTIDPQTGIVWRFSNYGRTAGVQVWSKGSAIANNNTLYQGWIYLDTKVSGRLWISSDNGLFYIDNALTISTPAAGTKVAFGAAGSGLPYAGENCGPIGMYTSDGTLVVAVMGADTGAIPTQKVPRLLEVPNGTNWGSAIDVADDYYRGQCVHPMSMQVDSSDQYVYVGQWGSGIEVCKRSKNLV